MGGRIVSDADRRIAERVKAARLAAGISQTQLGHALGITFQQIQKYERASNRLLAGMLQAAAHRIGVPVASFFDDASEAA
ncbi:helix-turn-helix domain-containing protein [Methylobacterium sp. D48H]